MKINKITKSDLTKVNLRWLFGCQICWNYEKMQGQGYLFSMLPVLRKLYSGEKLKEMMRYHNQFYNTSPHLGGLILGADIAIEEKEGFESKEAVAGLKAGLMGSFGGVGDSIFILVTTILGSIAAYMAINGNALGVCIWFVVNLFIIAVRWKFIYLAYDKGTTLFSGMSTKLDAMTDAATILGVTVIGALVPTVVKTNLLYSYQEGELTVSIQGMLDQIMPAIIPVAIVATIFSLLGKKGFTSTRIIVGIMFLSVVAYNFGILG
ncbi:PTS system mannose/fructose/sorbose family transporter subunit IID [Vibrio scophthalmi]|uniref:N-acetylgalactosamine permease IID component n=1 Tax=Vibrio scophthalmi TaxID=45658 RepID=A0A1C7FGP1_9VIBR|nr:PTS system mannose/fructose/sorbose family transporter subunit IID [Vibrio scophthalmi]ANU38149.1 N-acetylgalactosamine permease IID component [Vibrio scophthalmi]